MRSVKAAYLAYIGTYPLCVENIKTEKHQEPQKILFKGSARP